MAAASLYPYRIPLSPLAFNPCNLGNTEWYQCAVQAPIGRKGKAYSSCIKLHTNLQLVVPLVATRSAKALSSASDQNSLGVYF
jgi:hypothetical protein